MEALGAEGDGDPAPVPAVRDRSMHWADAAGGRHTLSTVRPPEHDGSYVLFAAAA